MILAMLSLGAAIVTTNVATVKPAADERAKAESRFFAALREVEDSPNGGDGGRAVGPYSIRRPYWIDACKFDPSLRSFVVLSEHVHYTGWMACKSEPFARHVVSAYLSHYAPKAWVEGDWFVLAQLHHVGPTGAEHGKGKDYAQRVLNCMR